MRWQIHKPEFLWQPNLIQSDSQTFLRTSYFKMVNWRATVVHIEIVFSRLRIKNAFSRSGCIFNSSQGRAKITFKRNRKFYVLHWEFSCRKHPLRIQNLKLNLPSSLSSNNLSMHCFFWGSLAQLTVFIFGGGVGGKWWSVLVQKSGLEGVLSAILMLSTLATFGTRSHGW